MKDEAELHTVIREYLKENLEVTVWTEKHCGEYGDGVKVTVMINLDGELIAQSYDYTGL